MLRPVLIAALIAGLGLSTAHAQLPESVSVLLRSANIPEDAMGAIVLRGNTFVMSHGAERSMQPASTMKLVTTAVGLEQLGPTFRGRTELRTSADVINGVLKGDLILRGGADTDFNADVLEHMLQTLRNQGIVKIKGDLILDRQLFQPARPDIGAPPFDESAEFRYNVIPDDLLISRSTSGRARATWSASMRVPTGSATGGKPVPGASRTLPVMVPPSRFQVLRNRRSA